MKTTPRLARLSFVAAALAAGVAGAPHAFAADAPARLQTVAVLPPTGDNVAPDLLRAARDILKDHLERAGTYAVIEPPIPPSPGMPPGTAFPPSSEEPTAADAARLGSSVGAELSIVLRLTHFGNSARLRLTAYSTGSAQVVYWDSILITGGPDELDVAIQRLVHGMQTGKPVRESAELETVTDKESMNLARREANKTFGVRLTELAPFNQAGNNFDTLTAGGLVWLYDARSWMTDLAVDIGGGAQGRFFIDAAIGAYYPFLREDFTPYIGGQVRWAEMTLGGQGASGLILQPTVGLLLGRLSSVQIRGEVGYFFNTFGERETTGSTYLVNETAPLHYSDGFVFSIGIGF
ncbi:MAG TPA: hypothetical protein VH853_19455 [Polyangia bacterium]|jgi:hypothetical protein|nr:hypothetical protein [Polyangia bacterium]